MKIKVVLINQNNQDCIHLLLSDILVILFKKLKILVGLKWKIFNLKIGKIHKYSMCFF